MSVYHHEYSNYYHVVYVYYHVFKLYLLQVYRDLLKITGIRDLPQIFVNETFIGSWQDLKTLHKTGLNF